MATIETFTCGPIDTHGYLLHDGKKAVIIDAPLGSGKLMAKAAEGIEVVKILLTHSHWDHTADLAWMANHFEAPVAIHPEDRKNVEQPGSDGLCIMIKVGACSPDELLNEGDVIEVGGIKLQVIHTPGHTPGGVCFYDEGDGILFSGDTLFSGSIGNLSFSTGEPERMWPSLEKLAKLPPDVVVYPGHGEPTTIGKESWLGKAKEIFG